MRHRIYGKHLGRDKNQRTALIKNLVQSLILHGSIQTTEAKAKAIKGTVDKIINQAKSKNTKNLLKSFLINKSVQEKLIKEITPSLKDRNSGYTSVVKLGNRLGDGAMIVRMSLLMEESTPIKSGSKESEATKVVSTTSEVKARKVRKVEKPKVRKTKLTRTTRKAGKI